MGQASRNGHVPMRLIPVSFLPYPKVNAFMNPNKAKRLILIFSIVIAAAILLSSYLIGDSDAATVVMFLLIALWWIPFTLLLSDKHSIKSEYACLKRNILNFIRKA